MHSFRKKWLLFGSIAVVMTLIAVVPHIVQRIELRSKATSLVNDGIDQLKNNTWAYTSIISTQDIPLPSSMNGAMDAKVVSVYSPSVVKINNVYSMFFGVSLYCKTPGGGLVARDSIALAQSSDGNKWNFVKYVLEPNTSVCFVDTSSWSTGTIFQVNDPYVLNDNGTLRVLYTAVEWQPDKNVYGCGNIGITAFSTSLDQLLFRNDNFIGGSQWCNSATTGLSRPSLRKLQSGGYEVWMDSNYVIKTIPLTAIDRITNLSSLTTQSIVGGDVDTPEISSDNPLVLYNGGLHGFMGITAQSKINGVWTDAWQVTKLSGQTWDSWYQSSPSVFLESGSVPVIYFSGMRKEIDSSGNIFPVGTIGKAVGSTTVVTTVSTPTPTKTVTPTLIPTTTLIPTSTSLVLTPTLTPTPTKTVTPTLIPTTTLTPTPTTLVLTPTLTPTQTQALVLTPTSEESAPSLNFKIAFNGIKPSTNSNGNCFNQLKIRLEVTNFLSNKTQTFADIGLNVVSGETNSKGDQIFQISKLILDSSVFGKVNNSVFVKIKGPFHLSQKMCIKDQSEKVRDNNSCNISLYNGDIYNFSEYSLLAGDTDQNGVINSLDFSLIKNNLGVDVSCGITYDLNLDGIVNSLDLSLIKITLSSRSDE